MDISSVTTDEKKVEEGIWVKLDNETELLIGSFNSRKYRNCLRRKTEELKLIARKPTQEQTDKATYELHAEAILLGWRGMKKDGREFEYSIENARYVLMKSPTVNDFVLAHANDYNNFYAEKKVEEAEALGKR